MPPLPRLATAFPTLVVTLLIPALLLGCGDEPTRAGDDSGEIILAGNVFVVDTADGVWFVQGDSTSIVLGFSDEPPDLAPDDILIGSDQEGYLRRVVETAATETTLVVQTAEATLADVIAGGTISARAVLDPWASARMRAAPSAGARGAAPGVTIADDAFRFDDVRLFDGEVEGIALTVTIAEGWLRWVPELAVLAGSYPLPSRFRAVADGDLQSRLRVSVDAAGPLAREGRVDLIAPILCGTIPVVPSALDLYAYFGLEAGFEVAADGAASVSAELDGHADLLVGAEWESSRGWEDLWETEMEFASEGVVWEFGGSVEYRVYLRPYLVTRLAGSPGPGVAAQSGANFAGEAEDSNWIWDLHAALAAEVDLATTRFGLGIGEHTAALPERRCAAGADSSDNPTDGTPPSAAGDLRRTGSAARSATLAWTAPGDDATLGQATQYDIRYATSAEAVEEWDQALAAAGEPAPGLAGTAETFAVTGLEPETTYYFGLRTADEGGNWSVLSNIADAATRCEECWPLPMVTVPAGSFTMGDGVADCGTEQRPVTLTRAFSLGQHEVTNREYAEMLQWALDYDLITATPETVIDALGSSEELIDLDDEHCEIIFDDQAGIFGLRQVAYALEEAYPGGYDPAHHPVKEITWHGAAAFCNWLSLAEGLPSAYDPTTWECHEGDPYGAGGYRLPTDAEWEYATQYAEERTYPWGEQNPHCQLANHRPRHVYCVGWTAPVGSYPTAPETLGLYDMAGNVWEWCNDWWSCDLGTSEVIDPIGPATGSFHQLRGGSWISESGYLRCAFRQMPPGFGSTVGFRVARTVIP